MSENEELQVIPEQDPWDQLPNEPARWYNLFSEFRLMGPSRTLLKFYRAKRTEAGKTVDPHLRVHNYWAVNARDWKWRERAAAWDAVVIEAKEDEAEHILGTGLALSYERVRRLSLVAEKLEGYILDPTNKRPSPYVIEQYRGALDDIAKEKGERGKEIRFTGAKGGPIVIETSWGRGGSASDAWESNQISAPVNALDAVVVSEVQRDLQAELDAVDEVRPKMQRPSKNGQQGKN